MSVSETAPKELVLGATLVGANRGGLHHVAALQSLAAEYPHARQLVRVIDAVHLRAERLAADITAAGGHGIAVEARLEDILPALAASHEPLILATDSPGTDADALHSPETAERWVFPYVLVHLPSKQLLSLRGAIPPGDSSWRDETAALLLALSGISARRGGSFAVGEHASSAARALEPRHRASMAEHLKQRLRKVIAGLPLEGAPLTVSVDGVSELSLFVTAHDTWEDPLLLGRRVTETGSLVLPRNQSFSIAETTPEGVRFHFLQRRSNGGLLVRGRHAFDTEALRRESTAEENERRRQAAALTRLNPVDTTD